MSPPAPAPAPARTLSDVIGARRSELAPPPSGLDLDPGAATPPELPLLLPEGSTPPPAGAEGGQDAGEAGEGDAGAPTSIVVKVPGRHSDDPDYEIELPHEAQEAAERLAQLRNGYLRGEEVRAAREQVLAREAALEERMDSILVDPVGFVGQHLDPTDRAKLALHLLTDPGIRQLTLTLGQEQATVEELLARTLDPNDLPRLQSELRVLRADERDERRTMLEERRQIRQLANVAKSVMHALIPPTLPEEARPLFLRDAANDLLLAARQSESGMVHPRDVPRLLWPRLRALGMTEEQVQAALDGLQQSHGTRPRDWQNGQFRPTDAPPASGPAAPTGPRRVPAKPTIQQLREASARRAGAATAPPGAGAPAPVRGTLTPGVDIKAAVQEYRNRKAATPA